MIRSTYCFTSKNNGYPGGFPLGFLDFLKNKGYWGENRVYLCSGAVEDYNSVRVDVNNDVNPTLLEDSKNTSIEDNYADFVLIDPPYSRRLSAMLYGTLSYYHNINEFLIEGVRIAKKKGLIITLTYEVPFIPKNCKLIELSGIYQRGIVSRIRCLAVYVKR